MLLKLYIEPYSENSWVQGLVQYIPHIETSIEECDYIVSTKLVWGCANPTSIQETLHSYRGGTKKVIIFLVSDYNEPVDIPENILFFRTGLYKSQKKSNEYLLPFIGVVQELQNTQPFPPLEKRSMKPTVGFCGYVVSHPSRVKFINTLKMIPNIEKKIILKSEYWGGNPHNPNIVREFVENIRNSHFTLSTRGTGNWSARFYQVMYLGRVPIFVNTDMILPFEDRINWRDLIVYCDSENDIGNNLRQFWMSKDIV